MKKYILFFMSIGIILGAALIYNVVHISEEKKMTFSEPGYILNGTTSRYYFGQNEKYTSSYNNQIIFHDTEGEKVTLGDDNFVHYNSGNIEALQDSVLLDLSKINDNPIVYYNVSANKEIKKISNRYSVRNLDSDLQFEQAIWKISANKYIVLGNKLTATLNNGVTKEADGYIELQYSDNEVVSIYNQDFNSQTISSNSYIDIGDGIKLNLGTKIVSQNDVNKMSLEDMVINSNDNVTLVDLNKQENENKDENNTENTTNAANETNTQANTTTNNGTNTGNSNNNKNENGAGNNTTNAGNNSQTNTTVTTNTTTQSTTNGTQNTINIITPDIMYEYVDENENKVDETVAAKEPKFKLENLEVTAVGIQAELQIKDDDDTLSKNDNINIKITNNSTGKVVYTDTQPYGTFKIPINIETLAPDTSYTITASATYVVNEKNYTKDFLYKTFVTSTAGVELTKDSYTNNSLAFNINFSDKLIDSADVALLDSNGNEIPNRKQTIKNNGAEENVTFDGLTADTDYTVRLTNISYNGIIQDGDNWNKDLKCKTLKTTASINKLNYAVNKRNGTFTLYINDVTDDNGAIQSYKYVMYKYTQIRDENGKTTLDYDTTNVVYQKDTTNKEITIPVNDDSSDSGVVKGQYYGFKVIATTYDNEKYVDIESPMCGVFTLNGSTFPSVKFERVDSDYPPTEIRGWLYIVDNDGTITVDQNNPLTITYYSDVDEGEVYVKRTGLTADERTTDTDGNEVIKIWVDLGEKGSNKKGLKAETSYTFAAYGTVNLKDENGDYKNAHIGSAIVTTGSYQPVSAKMTTSNIPTNSFTVDLSLQGDEVAKEGLSSVNLMLYEGSGDINTGEYKHWSRTITANNFTSCLSNVKGGKQVNSMQDLFFNNELVVTPSFIGGGKESSYTELNYQVVVTATVDGTTYTNKIPVQSAEDEDDNTGNTTYTDSKTAETYSAAYIIVKGKGTVVDVPDEYKKLQATAITNENATKYGIAKDENLNNSTYVGYYVNTSFANTGSLTAKYITYYAWDKDGSPVLDGNGNQLIKTANFINQEKAPSATFELKEGTIDSTKSDNTTGLHRGNAYYFSYTVTYQDTEGNELVWPTCKSDEKNKYDNQSLKTEILYPNKQEPNFVMYPKTSNETTITYVYSCTDPDKALYYPAHSTTEYGYLSLLVNGTTQSSNIEVRTDGEAHETIIGTLSANTVYQIGYTRNLNKAQTTAYTLKELIKQKFEGIVDCKNISIENIVYNDANNPNSVIVQLTGNDLNRVAAAQVTLDNGQEQLTTELLKLDTDNGNYLKVDLLQLLTSENVGRFTGKDITLKVKVYYDNGRIGYLTEESQYATYANSENTYMRLDGTNFVEDNNINGNIYEYKFYTNNENAQLGLKDLKSINNNETGKTVDLQYSGEGFKQNNNILVQKQIMAKDIDDGTEHKINIHTIRLGLKMNNITTTISTANVSATIINPVNVSVNGLTMEIWHSKDANAAPNWNSAQTKVIDPSQMSNITLDNLAPAEYYYIRFKYLDNNAYVYLYDKDSGEIGKVYSFETLATIGIENVNVEYEAQNYKNKYLNISYNVNDDRSTMYAKTKYTFYKKDGTTKINLSDANIKKTDEQAEYKIVDGSLVVSNTKGMDNQKFDSVKEQVKISPDSNPFTMGDDYVLKITPIVIINGTQEYEIDSEVGEFNVKSLQNPSIGLKMERKQLTNDSKVLRTTVSIKDQDALISGTDWGEYTLRIYKYKDNVDKAVEVNTYDKSQGGNNITGKKLNLKENATNYTIYVQSQDTDYTYNYIAKLELKYDKNNNGKDLENHTEKYTLKAISNDQDVAIGSATLVPNGNKCEIRFYDSYYNIKKINRIDYTVYNLNNNYSQTGTYKPEWTSTSQDQNVIYFKTELPVDFTETSTYTIKLNLYVGDVLVGQVDTTFIKEQQ